MKQTFIIFLTALVVSCNTKKQPPAAVDLQPAETMDVADHTAKTDALPSFNMRNANGSAVNLNSFQGKKVMVNIWASWCPPCKREMPSIEKLYKSVDTSKVAFVLLSLDDSFDEALRYVSSRKLNLPVYYPAENLPLLFNVQSIPNTFIFDESGKLVKHVEGADDFNTASYKELFK